uniref:Uncharacterized protein n=1 Tax=Candidatus Kentrum eta TaxID=2126337 RepID=A0A450UDZ2_9GAMM|nr:MAG: hypothetical protein BECKH772A_GA0070896_1002326 [Candidatus Kentron sp. H]VFJ91805.1 MAG: hypothetical protein BECKH772B_GA0070898_1002126 [Candidatus Kentron sp. H]VFJ98454.1 MAG: hypothetical protein BECKH772C_GA0070978_1002126 [Candidatus Kentron sp. H]
MVEAHVQMLENVHKKVFSLKLPRRLYLEPWYIRTNMTFAIVYSEWDYGHKTVCYSGDEYARDIVMSLRNYCQIILCSSNLYTTQSSVAKDS